jgi:hypothetical protein
MQHKQALQRSTDGRWDYTSGRTPIGYCHEYSDPMENNPFNLYWPQDQIDAVRNNKHKYHTDGHATKEEACDCYKEYTLDHHYHIGKDSNSQHKCQVCKEWTQNIIHAGMYQIFILCDKHANREEVSKLLEIGESWES